MEFGGSGIAEEVLGHNDVLPSIHIEHERRAMINDFRMDDTRVGFDRQIQISNLAAHKRISIRPAGH